MSKKNKIEIARSSAAEYLNFVAAGGNGGVDAIYSDENVWLSQKMIGQLYDVETHTVNYHLKKVFADSELEEASVIRKFRITETESNTMQYCDAVLQYCENHYYFPLVQLALALISFSFRIMLLYEF